MSFIAIVIEVAKIAIATIILYFVVPLISTMPANIQKLVQALIVLIAILVVITMFIQGTGPAHSESVPMLRPPPSIIR